MADRIVDGLLATHRQHESTRRARTDYQAAVDAAEKARRRARLADLHARVLEPILTQHAAQLADAGVTLTATAHDDHLAVRIHDARRSPLEATLRLEADAIVDVEVPVAFDRLVWTGPDSVQWTSSLDADAVDAWARLMLHSLYRHFLRSSPKPSGT